MVRHACAGRKEDWPGPDAERPLDAAGEQQALALADALVPLGVRSLLSSPARRCTDTLRPLAERLGLAVETSPALSSGSSLEQLVRLLTSPDASGAAMCTHGETMAPLAGWLSARGCRRRGGDPFPAKGTAWLIELDAGVPTSWRVVAPLEVAECPRHPAIHAG